MIAPWDYLTNPFKCQSQKWSNILKQFVSNLPTNWLCLTILWGWNLKGYSLILRFDFYEYEVCLKYEIYLWNMTSFLVQNNFFLRNHYLNEKCCIKCITKGGHIKVSLQTSFEVWILVSSTMQQNQIDLILLHVAGNKIHRQKCWNQNYFAMKTLKHFHAICYEHIFLAVAHENRPVSRKRNNF